MIGNLTASLQSVADAAATTDWIESNYLTQNALASTYATQATVSANYPTTTQAIAMSDAVRTYAETLVEVNTDSHFFPLTCAAEFQIIMLLSSSFREFYHLLICKDAVHLHTRLGDLVGFSQHHREPVDGCEHHHGTSEPRNP